MVFTPKGHENVIPQSHKEELHKYTTGIIQNRKHKLLAINFMRDHVHIFFGYHLSQPIPDLVRDIKAFSSKFINEQGWMPGKFQWQEGYGMFSISHSHIDRVVRYIHSQEAHHESRTFREEYLGFLEENEIKYDPEYLFNWIKIT